MKKILLFLFFGLMANLATAQSNAQFGDWEIVCWDSAGVVAPLQVRVSSSNTNGALIRTYYRFASGALAKVVPGTGTIGACSAAELQDIIIQLSQVLVDNDTIIAHLQQQLIDNDTVIVKLQAIATAIANSFGDTVHVVTEPGCLVLSDTLGCGVEGLRADVSALPPGWKSTYLNGTQSLGANQVSSCSAFAYVMNTLLGTNIFSCCNDSLVVNSLDTSLYNHITFISNVTGDTIVRYFADTVGTGISTQTIPVEIIKVLNRDGDIIDLRYFSSDGTTEYTGQGELTVGACLDGTTDQYQQNVALQLSQIVNLLGGGSDTCQVLNKTGGALLTSTTTYATNTKNSIAIESISGTVTLSLDGGAAFSLPTGTVAVYNGRACQYLDSSITINITSGSALVTWIY